MSRPLPPLRTTIAVALLCIVIVFGVLALRVRAGQDPALGAATVRPASTSTSSSGDDQGWSTTQDPYGDGGVSDDGGTYGDDGGTYGDGGGTAGVPYDNGGAGSESSLGGSGSSGSSATTAPSTHVS
jgi:hypothetical protein